MDMSSLIERAKTTDGSPDERLCAFGEVVRRFQDMAVGYAYSILADFHFAEDAAQEAFITAYRKLDSLREPCAFAGWLRRLVRTACDRFTRRKKVGTAPLEAADGIPSGDDAPAEAAERAEMRDEVLRAIGELPEEQRTATTLFYINGYSHSEIADFLEVPESTVNNRLHASREKLKERTLKMVKDTLHRHAPDERFSAAIIESLVDRPNLLKIDGHPARLVFEAARHELDDFDLIEGDEVIQKSELDSSADGGPENAYHVADDKCLRTSTTPATLAAMAGREPPVKIMTAGRAFRAAREDARHQKVFHQIDVLCIDTDADEAAMKTKIADVVAAVFEPMELEWRPANYPDFEGPMEACADIGGQVASLVGCGLIPKGRLREAGFDPDQVSGYAFGLGLERMAMLKFGIDDIRKLWQPPYVPE